MKENGLFEGMWVGTSSYLHCTKPYSPAIILACFLTAEGRRELYSIAQVLPLSDFRSLILNTSLSPFLPCQNTISLKSSIYIYGQYRIPVNWESCPENSGPSCMECIYFSLLSLNSSPSIQLPPDGTVQVGSDVPTTGYA